MEETPKPNIDLPAQLPFILELDNSRQPPAKTTNYSPLGKIPYGNLGLGVYLQGAKWVTTAMAHGISTGFCLLPGRFLLKGQFGSSPMVTPNGSLPFEL